MFFLLLQVILKNTKEFSQTLYKRFRKKIYQINFIDHIEHNRK